MIVRIVQLTSTQCNVIAMLPFIMCDDQASVVRPKEMENDFKL